MANLIYSTGAFNFNGNYIPVAAKALDARTVIDSSKDLNDIPNKYAGMVVTVLNDGVYYASRSLNDTSLDWVKLAQTTGATVDDLAGRVNSLESRADAVDSNIEILNTSINTTESSINSLESRANTVDSNIEILNTSVNLLESRTNITESSIGKLQSSFSDVQTELGNFKVTTNNSIDNINSSINRIDSDVATLNTSVNNRFTTLNTSINNRFTSVESKLTNVYHVKGSVDTINDLPSRDTSSSNQPEIGDVYNDKSTGINYVYVGDNIVGDISINGYQWDQLGTTIDLSGYYTKDEVDKFKSDTDSSISIINTSINSIESTIKSIDSSIKYLDSSKVDVENGIANNLTVNETLTIVNPNYENSDGDTSTIQLSITVGSDDDPNRIVVGGFAMARVSDIDNAVSDLNTSINKVNTTVSNVSTRVTDMEAAISDNTASIEYLDTSVADLYNSTIWHTLE